MTVRMNITIPDELHEQLQQVKDSINVSGVCQEAISKVVSLELSKMNVTSQVELAKMNTEHQREEVIARLKNEREIFEDTIFAEGKKQGLVDAVEMGYASFLELETTLQESKEFPKYWLVEALQRSDNFSWLFSQLMEDETVEPFAQDRYITAWVEGVMEFWNNIKDEV